jgi:molybdenum cofactor biosynthesis protein B
VTSHHRALPAEEIGCGLLTVSDTRTEKDDASGLLIRTLLEDAGYPIRSYAIVPDDPVAIRAAVTEVVERRDVRVLVVTGGTGIAPRDVTVESLGSLWTRELPGFGEMFRALSFAEIGPTALLSRATAGVIATTFVAVLPGSTAACRLAMERLIMPVLGHAVALIGAER